MPGFIWILIPLGLFSIYFATSGYVEKRLALGWTLLGIYFVLYLLLVLPWVFTIRLKYQGDIFNAVQAMVICAFLLVLQGPLLIEVISHSVFPDPSKGLKVIKVHTEAERLAAQGDLAGAIEEYERIVEEDPEDLDACARVAEICCENQDYVKAVRFYMALLGKESELGTARHCSILTRVSEIHAQHLSDVANARKYVQEIIDKYPGTRYARYAADRLNNL